MAIQLIAVPLSDSADLIAGCHQAFAELSHHPANQKNPYDIYVFTTSDGLQIEALLTVDALNFEISSHDLTNRSLASALFDLAQSQPCVMLSDEAPEALVADPKQQAPAALKLGVAPEEIICISQLSELFDVLFGVEDEEPPHSPDLAEGLLQMGFGIAAKDQHRATLALPDGCFLTIDPDEGTGWEATTSLSLSLALPRFAQVMSGWPDTTKGALSQLQARRMRQDTSGFVIWSGTLPFAEFPATVETPVLGLCDHPLALMDIVRLLSDIAAPKTLALSAYGGDLAPFVMPTEGLWVYLFLMAEAGCEADEIQLHYKDLLAKEAAFGTTDRLTTEIITAYLDYHAERLPG